MPQLYMASTADSIHLFFLQLFREPSV